MRINTDEKLGAVLAGVPGTPRVVCGGNLATPWRALALLDAAIPEYRPAPRLRDQLTWRTLRPVIRLGTIRM